MTISITSASSGPYTGNGATTVFPFTFQVMSADEVRVLVDGAVLSDALYSVGLTGGAPSGGNVTFVDAPASGTEVVIESDPDFSQSIAFSNGGPFLAESHDHANDRGAIRDIYLKDRIEQLPDMVTAENIASVRGSAAEAAGSAAQATAGAHLAAIAAASAGASNSAPAVALADIDETSILVIDGTTSHANNAYLRDDADSSNDYNGTLDALLPGTAFNVGKNVVDQTGAAVAVAAGDIPYDYSTGQKRIKVKSTDLFKVTSSMFTFGTDTMVVADFVVGSGDLNALIALDDGTHTVSVGGTGGLIYLQVIKSGADPDTNVTLGDQPASGELLEVALRLDSGIASASLNGEPWRTVNLHDSGSGYVVPDSFTPTTLTIGSTINDCYLGRLHLVGRAGADAEFQSWNRTVRPVVKAARTLGFFRDTYATDFGDRYREANFVLFDDGEKSGRVAGLAGAMHRYAGPGSPAGEAPSRIRAWPFSHTRDSGNIELGAPFILYEPEYWSSGIGHSQSYVAVKGRVGANKGKIFSFVHDYLGATGSETPGDVSTLNGSILFQVSEKNYADHDLNGWTTVHQAGIGTYAIPGPSQPIELPEWHPHAGRIGFPVDSPGGTRLFRRNADGTFAMSANAAGSPGTFSPNEAAPVLLPNGDILVFCRMYEGGTDAQNVLGIYRSLAATAFESLTFEALLQTGDGYEGAAASFSAFQLDLEGSYGPIGRIGIARALHIPSGPIRHGCTVSFVEDEDFTLRDERDILSRTQTSAYCKALPIFGGTQLVLVNETSLDGAINLRDSVHISIVELAPRANAL